MEWPVIIALVAAVPVILFPVAFIWYLNVGGIYETIKESMARRVAARKKEKKAALGIK